MNAPDPVWVCHECQMVGTAAEAEAHNMVSDHVVAELTHGESARIRAAWDKAWSEGGVCDE